MKTLLICPLLCLANLLSPWAPAHQPEGLPKQLLNSRNV